MKGEKGEYSYGGTKITIGKDLAKNIEKLRQKNAAKMDALVKNATVSPRPVMKINRPFVPAVIRAMFMGKKP